MASTKNIYSLPFKKKDLIRAVSDPRAHFGFLKHAIDFSLPIGTKILAAKSGIVIDVKDNSKKGGSDPKYNDVKYLNYISILHDNAEFSTYAHLKYKGSFVKIGDKVKTRQPIALSGNTGFTTTPHLHFQVFKRDWKEISGINILKIRFKQKIKVYRPKLKTLKTQKNSKKFQRHLKELEKVRKQFKA